MQLATNQYFGLDYVALCAAGAAGYLRGSPRFVLFVAIALSIVDGAKLWLEGSEKLSTKAITYVVTGVIANLGYATFFFFVGAIAGSFF